jgi:hypothetical protein
MVRSIERQLSKKISLVIAMLVMANVVYCQNSFDHGFIEWCKKNNLKEDYHSYCQRLIQKTNSDSAHHILAEYYLWTAQLDSFLLEYDVASNLISQDTTALNLASSLFLGAKSYQQKEWFAKRCPISEAYYSNQMKSIYDWAFCDTITQVPTYFVEEIVESAQFYLAFRDKKKSGYVLRSVVLPGWGRKYIGRKKSGTGVMSNVLLLGLSTYESIARKGLNNALSIVSLSGLTVFYVAEIYIGLKEFEVIQKERRKQLFLDAANYYYYTSKR